MAPCGENKKQYKIKLGLTLPATKGKAIALNIVARNSLATKSPTSR